MEQMIEVLKAIAQPTRLRILLLLAEAELCSCELVDILGITQPAVSQHMQVLKLAGLVGERKTGTWVYYQLQRENMEQVLQWLALGMRSPRGLLESQSATWVKLDQLLAERQTRCREDQPSGTCGCCAQSAEVDNPCQRKQAESGEQA